MAQLPRANGYKGIWFTLGQFTQYGDKYSGGLGTYTSSHVPLAIYVPAVDKTFFVYGGTTGEKDRHLLIMLSYFDHRTKTVPQPVIVYDKQGVDDPHDNASLSIDENGYIWVFVSGRNTKRPGLIFKSKAPYDISDFVKTEEGEMTYPQPWWLKGKGFMYLFTKYTKGRELYWSTSADGLGWSPAQKLAGMGGHYQVTNVHGEKIVSVFNYHPKGNVDKRTNCYLVQTTDMGRTWTTVDGQPLQTPLTSPQSPALVKDYQANGQLVYLNDLNFDAAGNPVVLAVVSRDHAPGPQGDPREWVIMRRKNGQWDFVTVCRSTHNYDMGSLYIDGDHWRIIGPTEAGPQHWGSGGEIAQWESRDGGTTWKKALQLTRKSPRNHGYVRRPLHAHPDFYALWADGDADRLSRSQLYFSDKKGQVYLLPFDMKEAVVKPVKVK
ncbi:BNR-4 repeat-containing protein [Chitinophaga lutea]